MTFFKELAKSAAWAIMALIVIGLVGWATYWWLYEGMTSVSDGHCNVAVVNLHSELSAYTYYDEYGYEVLTSTLDEFDAALRDVEADPHIQGVLISIDSPGGSVYAGEAMANRIERLEFPVVALVRDVAASSAYWAATGADEIVASRVSSVGGIGVTMSYLERVRQNEDNGLDYIEISSAPSKDAGNPDRFLGEDEELRFQEDVDAIHDEFVRQVADNRGLSFDNVAALADGLTVLGEEALALGLIDQLGDKEIARAWLATEMGEATEDVIFCE